MSKNLKTIFIVGVGRSGTSLLHSALNSHNQITLPPETHFVRTYIAGNNDIRKLKKKIINDKYLKRLDLDLKKLVANSSSLENFYKSLLMEYMRKENKMIVGDKDPKNIEYLKLIHSMFPKTSLIHIFRDPRAVISSRKKAKWSKNRNIMQHMLAYKAQLLYCMKIGRKLFSNYYEIRYEDLVLNPSEELKKLCTHIGVDFDENMLEFYKNSHKVAEGEETLWKENIFNPIMKQNIHKWEKNLTKKEINLINVCLSNEIELLGYKRSLDNDPLMNQVKKYTFRQVLNLLTILYSQKLN